VRDEKIPDHKYTIGSMLLQGVILLGFAALSYLDSLATTDPITFVGSRTFAVYFGVLGAVCIWLTGEYSVGDVKSSRLVLWSIICIILALYPIIISTSMFVSYGYISSLFVLPAPILFLVSSLAILVFTWGYDD